MSETARRTQLFQFPSIQQMQTMPLWKLLCHVLYVVSLGLLFPRLKVYMALTCKGEGAIERAYVGIQQSM